MVETLLLFVGAPVGLFVLISLLTVAPSIVRSGRGSVGWLSEPVWFGGPSDPHASVEPSRATELASSPGPASSSGPTGAPEQGGGGASARW